MAAYETLTAPPEGVQMYWWNPYDQTWGPQESGKLSVGFWQDPKTGRVWEQRGKEWGLGERVGEAGGAMTTKFQEHMWELNQPKAQAAQDVLMWRQRQAGAGTVGYQTMGKTGGT